MAGAVDDSTINIVEVIIIIIIISGAARASGAWDEYLMCHPIAVSLPMTSPVMSAAGLWLAVTGNRVELGAPIRPLDSTLHSRCATVNCSAAFDILTIKSTIITVRPISVLQCIVLRRWVDFTFCSGFPLPFSAAFSTPAFSAFPFPLHAFRSFPSEHSVVAAWCHWFQGKCMPVCRRQFKVDYIRKITAT